MDRDDTIEAWLGDIGADQKMIGLLISRVSRRGGHFGPFMARSRFNGERMGLGSGVARVLTSRTISFNRIAACRFRTMMVNGRGRSLDGVRTHLRYLSRDGTARDGSRSLLYGPEAETVDPKEFLEKSKDDRHQFRAVLASDDAVEYDELRSLTRRLMKQVGRDLRIDPDWVAADHFNNGYPHVHIVMRGRKIDGDDIVVAPEYLREAASIRASEIVSLDLGPRSKNEIRRGKGLAIMDERLTPLDLDLIACTNREGVIEPFSPDLRVQSDRVARLQVLRSMGLANEQAGGRWQMATDLIETLEAMERCNRRMATLDREVRQRAMVVAPSTYTLYEPAKSAPIIGRVISHRLAGDGLDEAILIVDGIDGRIHYVPSVGLRDPVPERAIVRISAPERMDCDGPRTSMGGVTSHEVRPSPSDIGRRLDVEILSHKPLSSLVSDKAGTWLDVQLASPSPENLGGGFGQEVRLALVERVKWLSDNGLSYRENGRAIMRDGHGSLGLEGDRVDVLRLT